MQSSECQCSYGWWFRHCSVRNLTQSRKWDSASLYQINWTTIFQDRVKNMMKHCVFIFCHNLRVMGNFSKIWVFLAIKLPWLGSNTLDFGLNCLSKHTEHGWFCSIFLIHQVHTFLMCIWILVTLLSDKSFKYNSSFVSVKYILFLSS